MLLSCCINSDCATRKSPHISKSPDSVVKSPKLPVFIEASKVDNGQSKDCDSLTDGDVLQAEKLMQ